MESMNKIGVFLTDSPADDSVVAYARMMLPLLKCTHGHFIHLGEGGMADEMPPPSLEEFRSSVTAKLGDMSGVQLEFEVDPGRGIPELLYKTSQLDLDLVIIGRRLPHGLLAVGSRLVRLVRKCPCSVMVIPPGSVPHASRLMVATDFSPYSKRALELAIDLAGACGSTRPELICYHVFDVPYGHQYSGETLQNVAHDIEQRRRREFDEFLKSVDSQGIKIDTLLSASHDPPAALVEMAAIRKMDLIVVGSRGRATTATAMIGQFSERLAVSSTTSLLIVKRKGETLSLLEALRKLV
jgi:nucleotide-binding universal stress UspA family protein